MTVGFHIFGAIMVFAGCTAMGFSAASLCRRKVKIIQNYLRLLDLMITELGCRMTPLPELCRIASGVSSIFRETMIAFSESLDGQIGPNPVVCMEHVLTKTSVSCPEYGSCMRDLAGALGCYDLTGQIRQLENLCGKWNKTLEHLENDLTVRVRYFRTLGICAGCALAILLV